MEYRKLGKTDIVSSALGFGCASLLSRCDERASSRALREAFDRGINFYDTADFYGQGDSERMLGRFFKGIRDKVIISTKAGLAYKSPIRPLFIFKNLLRPFVNRFSMVKEVSGRIMSTQVSQSNFSPTYLTKAIDASLRRLRTDYIDIFMLHNPDQNVLNSEETLYFMDSLKARGKTRYVGLSCDWQVASACLATSKDNISALQIAVNPMEREILGLLPLAKQKEMAVIARAPFAGGRVLQLMNRSKDKWGERTAAQAMLQFLLQREDIAVVLAGMTDAAHISENVGVFELPRLTEGELSALKNIHEQEAAHG